MWRTNSCKLPPAITERSSNVGFFLKIWPIFRIPCHSFTCHWIRKASIVLCLVLESLTTHVNEVDQSGRVFCSYSKDFILRWEEKLIRAIYDELISLRFSFIKPQEVQYSRPLTLPFGKIFVKCSWIWISLLQKAQFNRHFNENVVNLFVTCTVHQNIPEYEFLFFKKLCSIHASSEMLLTCS